MTKFNLTGEQKLLLGCTGVVVVAAGAVLLSNHMVNKHLKQTMSAVARNCHYLDDLGDAVDSTNETLEDERSALIKNLDAIASAMTAGSQGTPMSESVKKEGPENGQNLA